MLFERGGGDASNASNNGQTLLDSWTKKKTKKLDSSAAKPQNAIKKLALDVSTAAQKDAESDKRQQMTARAFADDTCGERGEWQ